MLVSSKISVQKSTRKAQIFNASLELMRRMGYLSTSMRDIASAVKMEAASLYNHISGKEVILSETCFLMAEQLLKGLAEVNDIYFNPIEKLSLAVKNHVKVLTENTHAGWVFVHEWRNLSEENRIRFVALRDEYEKGFTTILKQGEDEGVFQDVNNKFAVLTILASLNWVVEWYKPQGDMTPEQIAEKLTEFILSGLKKENN
ncbi:MAG: TetR/AcrR family transcriptional regulator [Sphingomonadales bacterium]|nr:TetR/AcrR family transcriptional regulator [Sphingomonadales bacterium]